MKFKLKSRFKPAGGQPAAIKKLIDGYKKNSKQTLLGITGSGKTFCMANVIQSVQKPTLILAHNKTLAAQLYAEFKELFPENKVEYFISYYDYYQPESYIPTSDTYIEKEATVNEQIEKMRLRTISSVLSRSDVIVVASISCIYGAGNPEDFLSLALTLEKGEKLSRRKLIHQLVAMRYTRNDTAPEQGNFRVRGDVVDIFLANDESMVRVELFGEEVDRITEHHPVTSELITSIDSMKIFPAKQFVVVESKHEQAISKILDELDERLGDLPLLESERLKKKVTYDMDMLREMGYCSGIENYSRYFDNRKKGEPPFCLLDYFPKDFLFIIDESHQSIPQSRAMYKGDFSRKKNLIDFGFRLPSAYDNRPLKFEEFEKYFKHTLFVSATPSDYELENSGQVVELIIRPTGLLDPTIEVRETEGQIKDLIKEIKKVTSKGNRILVTTLTKKMAENLTEYLAKEDIKVRYMHADIKSLDRIELIRSLRAGEYDVLVGINLLREGLDIPEVELVAILDADKEGFLRNVRSFIQTIGRASRNENGRVIMYASKMTGSMAQAIKITSERRERQKEYNKKNNIVPMSVEKSVAPKTREIQGVSHLSQKDIHDKIVETEAGMKAAAENLEFEKAIELRDYLEGLIKEMEWKKKKK
jgi:excinuclease ABC subunit B